MVSIFTKIGGTWVCQMDLILKGQDRLGHRSNFCFSEVLGPIWINVGECMDCNV